MDGSLPPDFAGQKIGSYRLLGRLGSGGMGDVFLAEDDRLARRVAIKRIRSTAPADSPERERLRREARAAASLSHPAVVQVYDLVEDPAGDSIVMEYVQGQTLAERLSEGSLDTASATAALLQITDGLAAAHAKGLIHRDLKAENVVVAEDGSAKILDFGVAKLSDPGDDASLTAGAVVGTYRSMSPEQCEIKPLDARSDLFSLGVLAYEMFTGRSPFLGKTPLHTLANVVGYDPPTVRELNRSVPQPLSDLIAQLLAKLPGTRPASAAVVADRLTQILTPDQVAGIVLPRLSVTPDSGVDPIQVVDRTTLDRMSRVRRPAPVASTGKGKGWGRRIVGGTIGIVLATALGWWLLPWGGRDAPAGPAHVMVFPLRSSAGVGGGASLGEDVATVIGHALDGVEPLQWIDGWPRLDPETRNDPSLLQLSEMADIARANGADQFVWGRVVESGDSVQVFLELYDGRTGEDILHANAAASASNAWRAGLRAVNGLLPGMIETEIPDVESDFGDRRPDAVARFLLGEAALRRAKFREALGHFENALAADSSFAVAGIRGAQAASWVHEPEAAARMVEHVLGLPLARRSAFFARGVDAYVASDAERAIENLDAAIASDSTFTIAWSQLGETYRHLVPRLAREGEISPFERAERLDSLAGYVLFHRLEQLLRDGDLIRARATRERFRAGNPDPELTAQIDIMMRCVDEGPTADFGDAVRETPWQVLMSAAQFGMAARQLPCAESLYRTILTQDTLPSADGSYSEAGNRFWNAVVGLTSALAARADYDGVRSLMDAAATGLDAFQEVLEASVVQSSGVSVPAQSGPAPALAGSWAESRRSQLTRWSELGVLIGFAHPGLRGIGERSATDLRALAGPELRDLPYRTSLWLIGLEGARQGRLDEVQMASERLREIAASDAGASERRYTERMADALEAHRTLASADTATALERFRGLTSNARPGVLYWELVAPFAVERIVQARLEALAGDPQLALRLIRGLDEANAQTHLLYLPAGLHLCEAMRAQIGTAAAGACGDRLRALGWPVEGAAFRTPQ